MCLNFIRIFISSKSFKFITASFFIFVFLIHTAFAQTSGSSLQEFVDTQSITDSVPNDALAMIGKSQSPLNNDLQSGLGNILNYARKAFSAVFSSVIKQMVYLLAISFICGCVSPLLSKSFSIFISACGVALLLSIYFSDTKNTISACLQATSQLANVSSALFPVIAAASVFCGHAMTASAISGTALLVTNVFMSLIYRIFLPLIYIYIAVCAINAVISNPILHQISDLIKNTFTSSLKLGLTIYAAYSGISSVISSTADTSGIKTAKLAISSAIPLVGSTIADATETLLGSAAAVKNSSGIFGLLVIIAICILPFITLSVHYVCYKFFASVCSVISIKPISSLVNSIGDSFGLAMALLGTASVLMFISVTLSIMLVNPI